MSLLWKVATEQWHDDVDDDDDDMNNDEHSSHVLHPAFSAVGIRPAPCGWCTCSEMDHSHSKVFDRVETRMFEQ